MPENNGTDPVRLWTLLQLALFTAVVPGTVMVWLPLFGLYAALRHRPIPWTATAGGAIAILAISTAGYIGCAIDFAIVGKGTLAPIDMPKVLVVRRPYKHTRNPMYFSVLTVLRGESAVFRSASLLEYAAEVAIAFHVWVLIPEEPLLRRKMGEARWRYCDEVPRWIPRIARRRETHAV